LVASHCEQSFRDVRVYYFVVNFLLNGLLLAC
jgi:hypothetical protein